MGGHPFASGMGTVDLEELFFGRGGGFGGPFGPTFNGNFNGGRRSTFG